MTREERKNFAASVADSILDSFSTSVSRAAALFESPREALDKFILPEINNTLKIGLIEQPSGLSSTKKYMGDIRNIIMLLGAETWQTAIKEVYSIARRTNACMFYPGDYICISLDVPEITIDGYRFGAIKAENVRLVVTESYYDAVAFNFEDVLFHAPINRKSTSAGGFKESLLAKYLNDHFLKYAFGDVEPYLLNNHDNLKVSLPTYAEVFGKDDDGYYTTANWGTNNLRHSYFKKCTNRIKVDLADRDDTNWWWLSTPYAGNTTTFAHVNYYGHANHGSAGEAGGGDSPAFCIS